MAQVPPGCLPVIVPPGLPRRLAQLPRGGVFADNGAAAARCIEHAVRLVQAGEGGAIVTAPVHKEALAAAGVPYPGHTEMLQALAGSPPVRMMLANDELRVVLVTIHMALRRAGAGLQRGAVTCNRPQRRCAWGQAGRIAVAGSIRTRRRRAVRHESRISAPPCAPRSRGHQRQRAVCARRCHAGAPRRVRM